MLLENRIFSLSLMLEHIIVIDIGTLEVKKCFQSKYSWHVIQFELMFASRVHSVSKTNHNFFLERVKTKRGREWVSE
ncbi:MAG: hypothetical protein DA329_11260 [Candidatus Nitrosocosmicus sp.]|jgi:hypothetical protein|nr:hypothetical protein [Candidatus Nitrosocosmicus sp.]